MVAMIAFCSKPMTRDICDLEVLPVNYTSLPRKKLSNFNNFSMEQREQSIWSDTLQQRHPRANDRNVAEEPRGYSRSGLMYDVTTIIRTLFISLCVRAIVYFLREKVAEEL